MVQLLIWTALVTRLLVSKKTETTSLVKRKSYLLRWVILPKSLIGEGVKLGVSSRGIGSLKQTREGVNIVGDDFMLATFTPTSLPTPLQPDAFVEGIMEGKDWVWDGGILRGRPPKKTYKQINTLVTQGQLDEKKLDLFNDFLNNL